MAAYKVRLLALLAFGLFGTAAIGQEAKDMDLETSGFVMRPALTPQQLERVKLLPPHKFIARTKNGQRYFLYADPDLCKCVFVGNALAMANYQGLVSSPSSPYVSNMPSPGTVPAGATLYQEMDPGLSGTIPGGDILDNPN
jgi:hypothetical protein